MSKKVLSIIISALMVCSFASCNAAKYTYEKWDGNDSPDELSSAASALFDKGTNANFISWNTGAIETSGAVNGSAHMASFDYAYNCVAVMEWIFAQTNKVRRRFYLVE